MIPELPSDTMKIKNSIYNEIVNCLGDRYEKGSTTLHSIAAGGEKGNFKISFRIYNFFHIFFTYDQGNISCAIKQGDFSIPLKTRITIYSPKTFLVFWSEVCFQLELRIPDKYLKYYGWMIK